MHYKIDPGINSGIVLMRAGKLAAFMTVDGFGGEELESAAIATSEQDWQTMLPVIRTHAKAAGAERVLFICDAQDQTVEPAVQALCGAPLNSEYRMVFSGEVSPLENINIHLRPATTADLSTIRALDAAAFGAQPTEETTAQNHIADEQEQQDLLNTRIIERAGQTVGKLRIEHAQSMCGIYGLVVTPTLRGEGIGTQALQLILHEFASRENVYLEVDTANHAALHVYKKCGFGILAQFDYYPLSL
ncbi:GNAT family N-acetyltransferase [Ruminococcaceae bacterium OttesenSCG-928-N02]|nr:GNAT family N-acetyltransferase [Ruminococcaceae bacterium OttesenSCG-928-N02]